MKNASIIFNKGYYDNIWETVHRHDYCENLATNASANASPSPVDTYATVGNAYTDKYTSLGSRNVD